MGATKVKPKRGKFATRAAAEAFCPFDKFCVIEQLRENGPFVVLVERFATHGGAVAMVELMKKHRPERVFHIKEPTYQPV